MRVVASALAALLLAACSTTQLVHDRVNANWRGDALERVAVVVIANQPRVRGALENALVEDLQAAGADTFAVHTMMMDVPETLKARKAALKALVEKQGADGVLVLSLVGVDTQRQYVGAQMAPVEVITGVGPAATPYWGYGGYYHRHYEYVYVPGYEEVTQDYRLDASLFAVGQETPVWQGETSTVDPASLDEGIAGVASRVSSALVRHKLVASD
jgi:hypothetical protein